MPIWIDDLLCIGDERHIKDCPQGVPIGGRGMNCAHKEDLILECSDRITTGGHYDRNGNLNPNIARNGRQILSTSGSTKSEFFSQPNDGQIGNTTKPYEVKSGPGNNNVNTQPFYAIDFNATYTLDTVKVRDHPTDLKIRPKRIGPLVDPWSKFISSVSQQNQFLSNIILSMMIIMSLQLKWIAPMLIFHWHQV